MVKSILKLSTVFTAVVAVVLSMSFTSCKNKSDEPEAAKVSRVELKLYANFSQDLLDLLTINVQTSINAPGQIASVTHPLKNLENQVSLSAGTFPATFKMPFAINGKRMPSVLKSEYVLGYEIEYRLTVYYEDGRDEVLSDVTAKYDHRSSMTVNEPTAEELQYYVGLTKDELINNCSAVINNVTVENGKVIVKG